MLLAVCFWEGSGAEECMTKAKRGFERRVDDRGRMSAHAES